MVIVQSGISSCGMGVMRQAKAGNAPAEGIGGDPEPGSVSRSDLSVVHQAFRAEGRRESCE